MTNMEMNICKHMIILCFKKVLIFHNDSCWIETDKGAIWGFVAPMLAIITVRSPAVQTMITFT